MLIAGGGVAALEAMVALRRMAGDLVEVALISPDRDFFYRPLSVGEPFGVAEVLRFDLPTLARGCGATHRLGTLTSVDAEAHEVRTSHNATFEYDLLLIATGARPREAVPGAITFRGQVDVPLINGMLEDIDRGLIERVAFALPGGVTWPLPLYELALLTAEHTRGADTRDHRRQPRRNPAPRPWTARQRDRRRPTAGARDPVPPDDLSGLLCEGGTANRPGPVLAGRRRRLPAPA